MRRLNLGRAITLLFALTGTACAGQTSSGTQATATPTPIKVAFVYNDPVGDTGWSFAQDLGRKYLVQHLPGVQTVVLQSIAEGATAEPVLERLAQEGYRAIFAASYGYLQPAMTVAQKYPNTAFFYTSGYQTSANVSTYYGATEQGLYLAGMIAAAVTKSNKLGFVGSFPIPSVLYQINAFTLGARSVNPNLTVHVVFSSTWYNPSVETQAANSLLNAGADVLTETEDSPAVGQAAQARNAHWIGFSGSDMQKFAPDAWLTGVDFNWGPYFVQTVKAIAAGTWKAAPAYYGSLADGNIVLGPLNPIIPQSTLQAVNQKKQDIISGNFNVFSGPIVTNQGKVIVPAGQALTSQQINSTNYLVQGAIGTIPAGS